jgi:integrase
VPDERRDNRCIYWDYSKQRVVNHPNALAANRVITDWTAKFDDYMDTCRRRSIQPQMGDIDALFNGSGVVRANAKYLPDAFQLFIDGKTLTHDTRTIGRYRVNKLQVEEYEAEHGRVPLEAVNEDFYQEFVAFLIKNHDNINKTILRKLNTIRTVCQYAVRKGILKSMDYMQEVNLKDIDTNRVPLNTEEREALMNYRTNDLRERRVVDAFITSMYCGLRYSDLEQLAGVHINSFTDEQGVTQYYLNLAAEKTASRGSIPLPLHVFASANIELPADFLLA